MKTGILTGFTGSIGKQILKQLLDEGAFCILPTRSQQKAEEALQEVATIMKKDPSSLSVKLIPDIHFDSLSSLRTFVNQVKKEYDALDFLVNNAAVVFDTRNETSDGMETMFQVNVVSYWLLMSELKPLLSKAKGRVVNVASNYAGDLDLKDLMFQRRRYNSNAVYRQTKACNRLLSNAAARQWKDITVNACHPGVVASPLLNGLMGGRGSGWDTAEAAAKTPVFLALNSNVNESGKYWMNCQKISDVFGGMLKEQDELWSIVEDLAH